MGKKILMAGGAGYVGSVLSPYLKKQGHDITVVDSCWFGNYIPADIPVIKKDIFDLTIQDLKIYDDIIFLGGLSNDPMAEFAPQANFIYNTALPSYLGFIAREAGVKRIVFAGSCSVYGHTHDNTCTELDPVVCNYPYGVSKLQGEQALLSLQTDNFSVICLRQGTISGFSPRMRLDLAINTMFKNAVSKHEITLSNPAIWRPILGIGDLCNGYQMAVESPYTTNGIFNLASFNTTVEELANSVKAIVEKEFNIPVNIKNMNITDFRNYKVNWTKAMTELNYKPVQQASDIINGLLANLEYFKNFDEKRFYNIEVFKTIKLNNHSIAE